MSLVSGTHGKYELKYNLTTLIYSFTKAKDKLLQQEPKGNSQTPFSHAL